MKKFILLALIAALVCAFPLVGSAGGGYAVVNNPNPADRLNLREAPSQDAYSLGKYYNGVAVQVLETEGDWARVCVGGTVGYMMRRYLADPQETASLPVAPVAEVRNPHAQVQWLLSGTGNDMELIVQIPNGAAVTLLGVAGEYVHVQYVGVAGYLPEACVAYDGPEEMQGADAQMPVPEPLRGEITRAELYMGGASVELREETRLAALSELLESVEDYGAKMASCPFGAAMTLVFADGREAVIELATDDCCVYRYNGHDFRYARSLWTAENGVHSSVLFDLFGVR